MSKFVLLTEIKTAPEVGEWWDIHPEGSEEIRLFDTFEEAKAEMRKTVKKLAGKCDFFPFERGRYMPEDDCEWGIEEIDEEIDLLRNIINNTIKKPDYFYEDAQSLDIKHTDDFDHCFAEVGREDLILVKCYKQTLKMNIHNMTEANGSYFFVYNEIDDAGVSVNILSVRLFNTGKTKTVKKAPKKKKPNYETVTFGRYVQDAEGKVSSPITWRVLEKKDGMALLLSEKVLDHVQFSANGKNDWKESDLRKWLNEEFADMAFDDGEKSLIQESEESERVFVISLEEYGKYFPGSDDARAGYTDYCRRRAIQHYGTNIRDPYAFWWLRTANTEGGWGEDGSVYVLHVCDCGDVNPYEREYSDGVRPAIWVKM